MINNKVTYLYSKEENFDQKLNEFLRSRNNLDVNIEKIVFDIISQINHLTETNIVKRSYLYKSKFLLNTQK